MPFVYAALAFVVAGIALALAQGLIAGALGLRLIRLEPWRSVATVARIVLSVAAGWVAFDLAHDAIAGPSEANCVRPIYRYADGTEGTERPADAPETGDSSSALDGPLELPIYPVRQELVPC